PPRARASQRVPAARALGRDGGGHNSACCQLTAQRIVLSGKRRAGPDPVRLVILAPMANLSRRALLRLGAGAAAAVAAGTATPSHASRAGVPRAPRAPAAAPTMTTGSFVSAARGGVRTDWAIARPPGQS